MGTDSQMCAHARTRGHTHAQTDTQTASFGPERMPSSKGQCLATSCETADAPLIVAAFEFVFMIKRQTWTWTVD